MRAAALLTQPQPSLCLLPSQSGFCEHRSKQHRVVLKKHHASCMTVSHTENLPDRDKHTPLIYSSLMLIPTWISSRSARGNEAGRHPDVLLGTASLPCLLHPTELAWSASVVSWWVYIELWDLQCRCLLQENKTETVWDCWWFLLMSPSLPLRYLVTSFQ